MPAWLVSFGAHLALLLILALLPLHEIANGPLTLFLGQSSPTNLPSFDLASSSSMPAPSDQDPLMTSPQEKSTQVLESLELSEIKPIDQTASTAAATLSSVLPQGIEQGLSGRSGLLKDALLAKFGGNAETEAAVELGLQWLATQQNSDGSWSLRGPYSDGGVNENRTAATAMAVNAFLGAGYTPREGNKYSDVVRLGLAYLLKRQDKEGFFSGREPSRQQMYAQAIATIAVCEAFGMTGDSKYRIDGQKAIEFAQWAQSKLKGWRYDPREDADLSVTGWYLMALVTGKMTKFTVNEENFQSVTTFLESVSHDDGSRYAYKEFEPPSLSMTAEGLLCRIYLGWPKSHPSLLMAVRDDLLPNKPQLGEEVTSVYYWYYATQVLHHAGGSAWTEWNEAMKRVLPALQKKTGKEAGSWDPTNDQFGASGGRLYTTCLTIYCLEVYYRHMSMYE